MSSIVGFFSVKGGVGKTALTVQAAAALSRRGHRVAVVDFDITGTSVSDGLALQRFGLTRAETLLRRNKAAEACFTSTLLSVHPRPVFNPEVLAWNHPGLPGVSWYPSSPLSLESSQACRAMMRDAAFGLRVAWLLEAISESLGGGGVTLVDLPTGMFGVATFAAPHLTHHVLVSGTDLCDLRRSADEVFQMKCVYSNIEWWINLKNQVQWGLRDPPGDRVIPWSRPLSKIFQDEALLESELGSVNHLECLLQRPKA